MMLLLYFHDQKDQHKSSTTDFYHSQEGEGIGHYRKDRENTTNAEGLWGQHGYGSKHDPG